MINIIEDYELYRFDQLALSLQGEFDEIHGSNYFIVKSEDFEVLEKEGANNRNIYENNRKKFIIAKSGDNFRNIAEEFNMYTWQIYKYNDLEKTDKIKQGQMIYLQKKRNRGASKYHLFEKGETMYSVSQKYGIKLKKLYKRNDLEKGKQPPVGTRLKLK